MLKAPLSYRDKLPTSSTDYSQIQDEVYFDSEDEGLTNNEEPIVFMDLKLGENGNKIRITMYHSS